jgi:capsule polysaccharide export protein KpsE/RkpR
MSEHMIESLKALIRASSDAEQAKETIALLEIYGYKAIPALRELMIESDISEIRQYCKDAVKKLGWLPDEY